MRLDVLVIKAGIVCDGLLVRIIDGELIKQMPEKIIDGLKARTSLSCLGRPQDIGNAFHFLVSNEASFISGDVLRTYGGIVVGT